MKNKKAIQKGHKPTIAVYSFDREVDACSIIRIIDPAQACNWNVIWASNKDDSGFTFNLEAAHQANIIFIHRMFPSKLTEKVLRSILSLGIPIVYDLDDSFFDVPTHLSIYYNANKNIPYIKWILNAADLITVSTVELKKSLVKYTNRPIKIIPNIVDFESFSSSPRTHNDYINILISGTNTHKRDWAIIEDPIEEALKIYGEKINIIFFGDTPKRFSNHPSVKSIDFQPNYKKYATQLKELDVHAALVPLEDTKYNQCKSNIKWLEYSSAGIPGAYSKLPPYSGCIEHDRTGLLVNNTSESWFHAIGKLVCNPTERIDLAINARQEVLEKFSLENSIDQYFSTVNALFGQTHTHNITSELPIFHKRLYIKLSDLLDKHILWRLNK
jgi:processive 1,2-diacylglycerol beta-glucosyltransferase